MDRSSRTSPRLPTTPPPRPKAARHYSHGLPSPFPSMYSPTSQHRRTSLQEQNRNVWLLAQSDTSDYSNPASGFSYNNNVDPPGNIMSGEQMTAHDSSVLEPLSKLSYNQQKRMLTGRKLKESQHSRHVTSYQKSQSMPQVGRREASGSPSNNGKLSARMKPSHPVRMPKDPQVVAFHLPGRHNSRSIRDTASNHEPVTPSRDGHRPAIQSTNERAVDSTDPRAEKEESGDDRSNVSTIEENAHAQMNPMYDETVVREPIRDSMESHDLPRPPPRFEHNYPPISDPVDPARRLPTWSLVLQRSLFIFLIIALNGGALTAALLSPRHLWVLVFMVFIKSKDMVSTLLSAVVLTSKSLWILLFRPKEEEVLPRWILSLVPAYSETNEQIMKTVDSVMKHDISPHKQVICVVLDGKPRDTALRMTSKVASFRRPYMTFRFVRSEIRVEAGFIGNQPVIVIEKAKNAGKKDTLILIHDVFNFTRDEVPLCTQLLKKEIFKQVLPLLTDEPRFRRFDMIFCTDADSIVHGNAIRNLANAIVRDRNAIGACGVLLAEITPNLEWSTWHLFQQFQYTFGQYVRRQAEGLWGKVTCMPGCITMIAVRKEMATTMSLYANPVRNYLFLRHQVQYLGTDRRLTYCSLAQDKGLRTIFVPSAVSETVAPQTLGHYISQRQRWASNAYFNDYFYLLGGEQILITRLWALVDIVRLSLVYYRVANSVLFIYGLARTFTLIEIVPLLVVTQTPTVWYLLVVMLREPILRRRAHKLVIGMIVNEFVSPVLSVIVFTKIAFTLGRATWGKTGLSSTAQPPIIDIVPTPPPLPPIGAWSPRRLTTIVRNAVRHKSGRAEAEPTSTQDMLFTQGEIENTTQADPEKRFPNPAKPVRLIRKIRSSRAAAQGGGSVDVT